MVECRLSNLPVNAYLPIHDCSREALYLLLRQQGVAYLSKAPVIAIVDDDASFRRATTSFVRSLGYAAAAFASAEAFLQSSSVQDAHCLISDVQMPGMTGIELQDRLLAEGYRLPVIFITAFPEAKARGKALAAGAIGFLDKSFSDEQLISCLNAALATDRV